MSGAASEFPLPQDPRQTGVGIDGVRTQALQDGAGPPSPGVDIHAVLGLPRPTRTSERGQEAEGGQGEDSDTEDAADSDDDTEEWQEGEYLVLEEADEELGNLQTAMLSENASLARDKLVPIFTACCQAYERWISDNETKVSDDEMRARHAQHGLYRKVLEVYGSDVEWEKLAHAQRVERNKTAHEVSLKAKELGPPPLPVSKASLQFERQMDGAGDTLSQAIEAMKDLVV